MRLILSLSNRTRMSKEAGFTLIELLLAMTLFSFMMLIVMGGFLNVVRLHENGVAARDTQQNARFGLEQMVREARSAADVTVITGNHGAGAPVADKVCLTDLSVRYYVDVTSTPHRLHRDTLDAAHLCANPLAGPGDTAISSDDVNVVDLQGTIVQTPVALGNPPNPKALQLTLLISSRDASQLDATGRACDPTQAASQFCATTKLISTATLRGTP